MNGLDGGSILVGIDYRPADGLLYGLSRDLDNFRIYTIDTTTGDATAIGAAAVQVTGTTTAVKFGVDFNPAVDRLRVITDLPSDGAGGNTNNFRMNPITGALVAIDTDLDFSALPNPTLEPPEVTVAYTNNDTDPNTGTDLFGITSGDNSFVNHSIPNAGVLTGVGALGVDTGVNTGLDIFGPTNTAVAILDVAAGASLYTIDILTGDATLVGLVGDGTLEFIDVAVSPAEQAPLLVGGSTNGQLLRYDPAASQYPTTPTATVTAFAGSTANVRTTTADVNGDGTSDLIAVTGPGVPIRVTVISGVDNTTVLVAPFDPFGGNFTGGGFVSAADIDNDGRAEFIVSPDQGGGPRVSIFSRAADGTLNTRANFLGIDDPNFRGGVRTAIGDVNNDGTPDLAVAAGFLGGPRTAIFNGTTLFATPTRLINDFFAFPGSDAVTLRNGAFVAAGDVNGDGFDDLIFGGGPAPRVFILSGQLISAGDVAGAQAAPIGNFFVAGSTSDRGGVRVSAQDIDGDNRDDVVVGSGAGSSAKVRAYLGANFTTAAEPAAFQDLTVFGGATLADGVYVG